MSIHRLGAAVEKSGKLFFTARAGRLYGRVVLKLRRGWIDRLHFRGRGGRMVRLALCILHSGAHAARHLGAVPASTTRPARGRGVAAGRGLSQRETGRAAGCGGSAPRTGGVLEGDSRRGPQPHGAAAGCHLLLFEAGALRHPVLGTKIYPRQAGRRYDDLGFCERDVRVGRSVQCDRGGTSIRQNLWLAPHAGVHHLPRLAGGRSVLPGQIAGDGVDAWQLPVPDRHADLRA